MNEELNLSELNQISRQLRVDVLTMLNHAGSGHTAGALGMVDVFAVLFFTDVLTHDPQNPVWEERDRFVLSNGHICPIYYATMAQSGYFDPAELDSLRQFGSRLQGHPHRESLPGLETTSGPLGSGLSQAAGMALMGKADHHGWHVICVCSDGEQQEGNLWEGVMFAGKHELANLTAIIDRNHIQISGYTQDVMPVESLKEKYEAFNWGVFEVDGHDHASIYQVLKDAKAEEEKPSVIITHTTPGKGVDFMENDPVWHGKVPNKEELVRALDQLGEVG